MTGKFKFYIYQKYFCGYRLYYFYAISKIDNNHIIL